MTYPGGKSGSGVYQAIINLMPPHEIYVEPFLGAGGVMRRKRPAPIANIGIEADPAVIEYWTGSLANAVPAISVIHADGIQWLKDRRWTGRELVYCDPPYLIETRRQRRRTYRYELERWDHGRLLEILIGLPCMVMISGYDSGLYRQFLRGWTIGTFTAVTRGGTVATETVWMNYAKPAVLHDYRFVGQNYRQRQDLKRKTDRWRKRVLAMPMCDRIAVLSAMVDLVPPISPVTRVMGTSDLARAASKMPVSPDIASVKLPFSDPASADLH